MNHSTRQTFAYTLLGLMALGTHALAANVPVGFVDRQVAANLLSPTAIASLPDDRLLVIQQNGVIRLIKNNALLSNNFHTFPKVDFRHERGCMGGVADPNFATNHYVYFYCSIYVDGASRNRVLRVTENSDGVTPGSERVIFELADIPDATHWHMGGAMRFGTDGKLYISVGNHEDSPQPVATAFSQNLASPFGKVLRINADGTIPSDNPFYNRSGANQAIYMLGLRNPFVMDIQPTTGMLVVGDVGQHSWEEINKGQAGGNYGWPSAEGPSNDARFVNPLYAYGHHLGCAITGVQFYNPPSTQFPSQYVGKLFYADFCNSQIKYLDPNAPNVVNTFASNMTNLTNLALSANGSLYYLARNQNTGTYMPDVGTVATTAAWRRALQATPQA
jgi:glucose/arabinose dehydrogenase